MNFLYYDDPIPHVVVEEVFSKEELNDIWVEIDKITKLGLFEPPDLTNSALLNNQPLKANHGIFVERLYNVRELSSIIKHSSKFANKDFFLLFAAKHIIFEYVNMCNAFSSLLSYYETGNYYRPHWDVSVFTMCTWLFKEPKCFDGGDFSFSDYNHTIPIENNKMVIFPSFVMHGVSDVTMKDGYDQPQSGNGRYCISNFVYIDQK